MCHVPPRCLAHLLFTHHLPVNDASLWITDEDGNLVQFRVEVIFYSFCYVTPGIEETFFQKRIIIIESKLMFSHRSAIGSIIVGGCDFKVNRVKRVTHCLKSVNEIVKIIDIPYVIFNCGVERTAQSVVFELSDPPGLHFA
jgi:hypothetical protein